MRRPRDSLLATLGVGMLLLGCGPSLTTVHEGTLRFEHCYRVDLEPSANSPQQQACWSRWLGEYTYGQPRDRIDYARRRLSSLSVASSTRPELRLSGEHGAAERQFYVVAPSPSDVHATPPPLATALPTRALDASDAGSSAQNAKEPPASSCAVSCRSAWLSCDGACAAPTGGSEQLAVSQSAAKPQIGKSAGGKPGVAAAGCQACTSEYTRCMRGCFE